MSTDDRHAALHDLGNHIYAYTQRDGSWGFSNAGLIASDDGERAMLVDTLFDVPLTSAMLAQMRRATPAAERIDVVVNTHANGDHTWGNELVSGARIIASAACAREMADLPPAMLAQLMAGAPNMGLLGAFLSAIFGNFQFQGITLTPPTETFERAMDIAIGDRRVKLLEVGPAHTRGDVIVHVPDARVVYTGDILFHGNHPIIWAGPVDNWIRACETIEELDVEVVVPGHGPLAEKKDVRALATYLEALRDACRERYDAGMPLAQTAREVARLPFASERAEAERVYINAAALYREFGAGDAPGDAPGDVISLFQGMAELARDLGLYSLSSTR